MLFSHEHFREICIARLGGAIYVIPSLVEMATVLTVDLYSSPLSTSEFSLLGTASGKRVTIDHFNHQLCQQLCSKQVNNTTTMHLYPDVYGYKLIL